MTLFHYTARDAQGQTVSGTVEAADWAAAEQELVARGLVELHELVVAEEVGEAMPVEQPAPLSPGDTVELARYLSELATSGLPLAGGLRAIAKDLPPGRALTKAVKHLAAQIDSGQPLAAAVESFGENLSPHLRELILTGAHSGNLAQTLEEVLDQEGELEDLGRQFRQAVDYPLVLLAFLAVWVLFIALLVAPEFLAVYDDFGTQLPLSTTIALGISRIVPGLALAIAVACLIIVVAGRAKATAPLISRLWSRLPWIGPAWWYRGLTEFSGLMGIFLKQGKSLPDALRLTSLAARDAAISGACHTMAQEAAGGQALSTSLARRSLFPPTLVNTVAWGESHAALAEACGGARQMFRERVESQNELIRLVLPPLFYLLMGVLAVLMYVGMFGGLLNLVKDLS